MALYHAIILWFTCNEHEGHFLLLKHNVPTQIYVLTKIDIEFGAAARLFQKSIQKEL